MDTSSETHLEKRLTDLLSEPVDAARERARNAFDNETEIFRNRFVLFGSGNIGCRVLARLRADGVEPLAFCDNENSRWGKSIDGLDVLAPSDAVARFGSNAAFIVTIYNNRHSFPRTRDQLRGLGCKQVLSVIALRWKYCEAFLPYFHDDLPHKVLLQREAILDAFGLWFDEPSRREFVAQVDWRLRGDFDVLGALAPEPQYFPQHIVSFDANEVFVDVGAYDGDTIRQFIELQGGRFRRLIALEPDTLNCQRLVRYISELPTELAQRIEVCAFAVSDRARRLRFSNGKGSAAAFSDNGSTEVDCVRLDDLLETEHPTFIKMDIEGAELDAIEGCRYILAHEAPVLATCVYHVQDHLWKVPLFVKNINPKYNFFLRPYMEECWETVCYSVPQNRLQVAEQVGMSPSSPYSQRRSTR